MGTLVATGWGSVGLLGPVAVAPRLWGQGIGSRLVEAGVAVLDGWGATHQGLFTYADSPRHHVFYQRLGFWPRFLTAVMSAPVTGSEPAAGQPLSTADAATRPRLRPPARPRPRRLALTLPPHPTPPPSRTKLS